MKKILKQIEQIKGVVKVKNVGYNMAVVTCEPDNEPIIITEDGVPLFNKKDPCWWVNIDSLEKGKQKIVIDALNDDDYFKYFSTKKAAKEFIKMQEVVSDLQDMIAMDLIPASAYTNTTLTADQLKDGEIYVSEDTENNWVYRFKSVKDSTPKRTDINCYSYIDWDSKFNLSDWICGYYGNRKIRHATPSEAQALIRAEVNNNYFHGVNTTV